MPECRKRRDRFPGGHRLQALDGGPGVAQGGVRKWQIIGPKRARLGRLALQSRRVRGVRGMRRSPIPQRRSRGGTRCTRSSGSIARRCGNCRARSGSPWERAQSARSNPCWRRRRPRRRRRPMGGGRRWSCRGGQIRVAARRVRRRKDRMAAQRERRRRVRRRRLPRRRRPVMARRTSETRRGPMGWRRGRVGRRRAGPGGARSSSFQGRWAM